MKIKFCGAAKTVTGSAHLLTLDEGYTILLDCGLYQGSEDGFDDFNQGWLFKPDKIDCVVLSHAHIDHSGRLPKLVKDGYGANIYCTHATRDLASIMLQDSAQIQVKDAEYMNRKKSRKGKEKIEPLYEQHDAEKALEQFVAVGYNIWHQIHPDVDVLFRDSGHILGSASVTLRIRRPGLKDTYFGFTGDIGRPDRPILKDPVKMPPCDFLICESTYGNKLHHSAPDDEDKLLEIIKRTCIEQKGKLIIPSFSVGRTQEIVYMLDKMENEGKLPNIPVYVDSPLAVNATDIFRIHPECFDRDLVQYMHSDPDPFGFNRLKYITKAEDSKKLNNIGSCIIISASGMITAGRIMHHINNNIENPDCTVLIVGYCAPHTIGNRLVNGAEEIRVFGQKKQVRAKIEIMNSFSAHGDQKEMIDYLSSQDKNKLRRIFLVHGDPERQEVFRDVLLKEGYIDVEIPNLGESFRL